MATATPPSATARVEPLPPELLEGDKVQPGHPLFGIVWINPRRVSGAPCFYGTRVPVKNLIDSLAGVNEDGQKGDAAHA